MHITRTSPYCYSFTIPPTSKPPITGHAMHSFSFPSHPPFAPPLPNYIPSPYVTPSEINTLPLRPVIGSYGHISGAGFAASLTKKKLKAPEMQKCDTYVSNAPATAGPTKYFDRLPLARPSQNSLAGSLWHWWYGAGLQGRWRRSVDFDF